MITKRPDPEGRIGEVSGSKRVYCGRSFMQLIGEELMAKEMTTEGHKGESRGSERGHRNKEKKYAKANGIRQQLTQEEYGKEKVEIAVQLELLMELLRENEKDQRYGLLRRKRVKWQRLQQKRDLQISMQLTKEKIIDDFLSYWENPDQMDNVKPCIFVADNCDVITGFTEEDVQPCATVIAQEEVRVDAEEVDQSVAWISKATIETVELCDFQTGSLCVNVGTVSDDEMLQQCHREIALLEYWSENPRYDREIAEERVQYSAREQKDILEVDGKKARVADGLMVNANQHTDVLTEKLGRNSEQHIEVLPEEAEEKVADEIADESAGAEQRNVAEGQEVWEAATFIVIARATYRATLATEEALRPYIFYSNNCFVSTGLTEEVGENLLDKEIEMMRRMMMKEFRKRPAAVKQKRSSERKTAEDCKSTASGAKQHKIWRPGEEQIEAATSAKLQHKIWDPGKHGAEHMIRRS